MEKLITFAKSKKGLIVIGVIVLAVILNAFKSDCSEESSCDAPAATVTE